MTWIIATGNPHKLREIGQVLRSFEIEFISPKEAKIALDVEEWGSTFAENAVLKAIAFAEAGQQIALADDSGLEVAHLNWGPGVYSARFAGENATDSENNQKLIENLHNVDLVGRASRYRCVIAIAKPHFGPKTPLKTLIGIGPDDVRDIAGYEIRTFDGAMHGHIEDEPRGRAGFGYDPYFTLPDGRRVAELTEEEKNAVSHRGRALEKMAAFLASS